MTWYEGLVLGWALGLATWALLLVWANRHRELLIRWLMRRAASRMTAPAVKPADRLGASKTPGTGRDANLTP